MNTHRNEILGVLLATLALCLTVSFFTHDPTESPGGLSSEIASRNAMGIFGIYASYFLMYLYLGWGSFMLPMILGLFSYIFFTRKNFRDYLRILFYIITFAFWLSITLVNVGMLKGLDSAISYGMGGYVGYALAIFLRDMLGIYAFNLVMALSLLLLLSGVFNLSLYDILLNLRNSLTNKWSSFQEKRRLKSVITQAEEPFPPITKTEPEIEDEESFQSNDIQDDSNGMSETDGTGIEEDIIKDEDHIEDQGVSSNEDSENTISDEDITIESEAEIEMTDLDAQRERRVRYRQYKLPITDYLKDPIEISNTQDREGLHEKAEQLVHALETFGVNGKVVKISPGPVITLFEIEPAEGVRVNKFTNLSDDLARVMKAQRIRVIAPIPGSKSVGIELPNEDPAIVYLKNIINSQQFVQSESKLTVGLGKTTVGDAFTFELGKMPHLLVAGATGAGKSVCINTIIVSILYKAKPDEVKFIMVDPKKLELATYKSLVGYHLITAPNLDEYVMTTAENAVAILDSAITEMERRFQVFSDARVRNIGEYHERYKLDSELENVPFVVVLIDELADLMMTSGRAVEEPITRLAQKARAVGIHLVVATQRPSVDVITGLIKSNFPARISFQVSSKVDSRTILDQIGAEKLLGKGDMLFLLPGTAAPIRLHNAYIELDEIEAIMEHITSQPKPDEVMLPESKELKVGGGFSVDEDSDDLLQDAARLVIQSQQASVSLLQRKFRIGYSRAGRLIDELESLGIVSGYSGSKARDVLVDESYLENIFSDT